MVATTKRLEFVALLLVLGLAGSADSENAAVSPLPRSVEILSGTVEHISPPDKTFILVAPDGTRQVIHYSPNTVVFSDRGGAEDGTIRVGDVISVQCRRKVASTGSGREEACTIRIVADRVYLESSLARAGP